MSKGKSGYGGGYSQKDAKNDTKATDRQTSQAWHDARDEAAKSGDQGVPQDRHSDDGKSGKK